jgi:hypothetical protein
VRELTDRLYATLKERGIRAEFDFRISDGISDYTAPMVIHCKDGRIEIPRAKLPMSWVKAEDLADDIERQVAAKGGIQDAD